MSTVENSLLLLATSSFEGGNYEKAINFCESLIIQIPASFEAWVLKGRAEARIRLQNDILWPQSRASLEKAHAIAHSEADHEQLSAAWLECASAAIERLGEEGRSARLAGAKYEESAGAAAVASLAAAVTTGASKTRAGKVAGAAFTASGAAVASHYINKSKVAHLAAFRADLLRGAICDEALQYLEMSIARRDSATSELPKRMAAYAPSILRDCASDAKSLDEKKIVLGVDVGPIAAIAAKYDASNSLAPAGEWVEIYARYESMNKAISLLEEFLCAAHISFDSAAVVRRISHVRVGLIRQILPYTVCCCCLFVFYWLSAAIFGQSDTVIGFWFLTCLIGGGYSSIQIERKLGRAYPRFGSSVTRDSVKLIALETFAMYTGWYPIFSLKSWANRAAINGVLQAELGRAQSPHTQSTSPTVINSTAS